MLLSVAPEMSMGSLLMYMRPLKARPNLQTSSAQQPWDLERMSQHLVLSDSFAAEEASWSSGSGSSPESKRVEYSVYKQNRA